MTFTERFKIDVPQAPINVRFDAPLSFRRHLLILMQHYDRLKNIRSCVCFVTKEGEDPQNWAENDYMKNEIQNILDNCFWSHVYDVIEKFYSSLNKESKQKFEKDINDYFLEKGYGWKLVDGILISRGDEFFENQIEEAVEILGEAKLETSLGEIKEAINDMSKRPDPDITGAVQHAAAALECLCREICGDKKLTLGQITKKYPDIVPKPLDEAISKAYGFASEQGRHLREGGEPDYEEAELIVHLSTSLCTYLTKKNFNIKDELDDIFNL